jgi:hypothetical protein
MGFSAAGFFGQINANITDKKQYIRARVEEDRLYLREQGLKRQAGIQEQRGQYEQAARSLITRGADERRVLTTLEMDPAGLMEVFRRTDKDNNVTGANLNDMMSIAEDYRGEASMDEILNSILPTVQEMPNDIDPVSSRRRSVASWLGLDTEDALSNEVYNRQIVGGMTGDEIMAGMNLPIQAQGSNVGGVNFDFSSLGSDNTISVGDANDYYERANGDYDVEGMSKELAASKIGATPDELEIIEGKMRTLDALPLSGPARLNGIFESGLFPIGDNTRDLMSSNLGPQLFGVENFSAGARTALGFEQTEEDGVVTDGNPNEALGDPASVNPADPNRIAETAATPEVTTSVIPEPQVTPEEALAEEDRLKDYYGVSWLTPSYKLESLDELETMTNNAFTFHPEAEAFLFKVGDEKYVVTKDNVTGEGDASVFEEMSQVDGGRQTTLSSLLNGATLTPSSSTPSGYSLPTFGGSPSAPPESVNITPEEATADQQMLIEALRSDDITPEELNAIAQSFADKYGEKPLTVILDQVQNTSN